MKKSTMAVAALLTALSSAPMVSVAYADDVAPAASATCAANCCKATGDAKVACCKAAACKAAACKAAKCGGCSGH